MSDSQIWNWRNSLDCRSTNIRFCWNMKRVNGTLRDVMVVPRCSGPHGIELAKASCCEQAWRPLTPGRLSDYINQDCPTQYVPCILNGTPGKRYRISLKVAFRFSDISHITRQVFRLIRRASRYRTQRIWIDRRVELSQRALQRFAIWRCAGESIQTLKRKQN